jgi:hypothetical protein
MTSKAATLLESEVVPESCAISELPAISQIEKTPFKQTRGDSELEKTEGRSVTSGERDKRKHKTRGSVSLSSSASKSVSTPKEESGFKKFVSENKYFIIGGVVALVLVGICAAHFIRLKQLEMERKREEELLQQLDAEQVLRRPLHSEPPSPYHNKDDIRQLVAEKDAEIDSYQQQIENQWRDMQQMDAILRGQEERVKEYERLLSSIKTMQASPRQEDSLEEQVEEEHKEQEEEVEKEDTREQDQDQNQDREEVKEEEKMIEIVHPEETRPTWQV